MFDNRKKMKSSTQNEKENDKNNRDYFYKMREVPKNVNLINIHRIYIYIYGRDYNDL